MGLFANIAAFSWSMAVFSALGGAPCALAQKASAPVYVDPFDRAAGSASLTRASKEGRLFANPALLPQGGGFHRWIGTTVTVLANSESVATARGLLLKQGAGGGGDAAATGGSTEAGGTQGSDAGELVDKAFRAPVRAGVGATVSWVTSNAAIAAFAGAEIDLRAREYGATGLPEIRMRAETYDGVAAGTAVRTPWRWLSLGLTTKYLMVAEHDVAVEVTDVAAIEEFTQSVGQLGLGTGIGVDLGMLLFFQGKSVDLSFAGKVDDMGNTKLTGDAVTPAELKQVVSVGTGLTFHTGTDALHLSVDYRDLGNSYGEETFKRIDVGAKLLLRTYVGLAAGYHHGYPTVGAELDLILLRLTLSRYTRELGDRPGVDPRHIYALSLGLGF